jgi:hypothetical protein
VIDTSRPFSVAAWVKLNAVTGTQTFASIDGVNTSGFYLQLRGTPGDLPSRASPLTATPRSLPRGRNRGSCGRTWYHLLGVSDVASSQIRFYVTACFSRRPPAKRLAR